MLARFSAPVCTLAHGGRRAGATRMRDATPAARLRRHGAPGRIVGRL